MTTNPYQAPESVPDGPANVDYDALPLTLPRRSRLERVYPILLAIWAAGMVLFGVYASYLTDDGTDALSIAYGALLILASAGIWRGSRVAEIIAIIQLAFVWITSILAIVSAAGVVSGGMSFRSPFLAAMFYVTFLSLFVLPSSVLLILAWLVWRERSD